MSVIRCSGAYETARTVVKLRRDDRPLLELFAAVTGLGCINDVAPSGATNPAAVWSVLRQSDLPEMVELLASAGLRGRKAREFAAWRTGVAEFTAARREGRRRDHKRIEAAGRALKRARRYAHTRPIPPPVPGDDRAARSAFIAVLRTWSDHTSEPLSCTRYGANRRRLQPSWPKYDTIASTFGSWYAALEAAGLADRAARRGPPRRSHDADARRIAPHRVKQRRIVEAAVREHTELLGRPPRACEFFRWRLAERRDLPSQATVYRLYPGGWDMVCVAAGVM